MKKKNFVSIIIPCYNSQQFIRRAINSVLKQSYRNFEIIAVNDGSKDSTSSILDEFKKKIKIIHIKNSGPSVARNIGIRKSKGELISFLDSDDYWHKDKLKIQVNFMNKYEDIKIVTSNLWSINKKKRIKKSDIFKIPYSKNFNDKFCITYKGIYPEKRYFYSSPSCLMVRKSIFKKYGLFNKRYKSTEDSEIFLRWMINGEKSIFINRCLAYYNVINPKSLTKNINNWILNHFKYWIDIERKIKNQKILADFLIMRKKTLLNSLLIVIKNLEPKIARDYIVKHFYLLVSFKVIFIFILTLLPLKHIRDIKNRFQF